MKRKISFVEIINYFLTGSICVALAANSAKTYFHKVGIFIVIIVGLLVLYQVGLAVAFARTDKKVRMKVKVRKRALKKMTNGFITASLMVLAITFGYQMVGGHFVTVGELDDKLLDMEVDKLSPDDEVYSELYHEKYDDLSNARKMKALTNVAVMEANHLGIEMPKFQFQLLEERYGGYFNDNSYSITINTLDIDDEIDVVNTILHEMYHAYELKCSEGFRDDSRLLWAEKCREWQQAFDDTSNSGSSDSYFEYYSDVLEIDARAYAKERIEVYKRIIG